MKTYEEILSDMLTRIPNDIDKRQGSIIYNALAPSAAEMAQLYIALDGAYSNTFVGTATGEDLDLRATDYGLIREQASKAIRRIAFIGEDNLPFNVDIGTRFSTTETNSINYIVLSKISDGQFNAQAETPGTMGNTFIGAMLPLDYIAGLKSATMTDVVIPAQNAETDFEFRKRIQSMMINEISDGNKAQYIKWATEFEGISRSKVFSLWNGANTVKVSILDNLHKPASVELINSFQSYIDPGKTGMGDGVAPIGAIVTVSTATELKINITGNVKLNDGYSAPDGVNEALTDWLYYIAYNKNTINYFEMVATILACPSVDTVESITLNGSSANINLTAEQVGVLGTVDLTVVR